MPLDPSARLDRSVTPAVAESPGSGLLGELVTFWRQFVVAAFDPYRPELHYMRGPGPACRAKREAMQQARGGDAVTGRLVPAQLD